MPHRPLLAHDGRHDDRLRHGGRFRGLLPVDRGMGGAGAESEEAGSEEGVVSRGRQAARALGGKEKVVSGGVSVKLLLKLFLNIYKSIVCVF